ncbi:hypothetical protein PNEG_02813 [Pneumocystis murina B123]|uniref:Major facilitator superfamily (MFS) profile domain-containing protein n=1 Tax=Pneumocystis murina (strain B123) TaxID=1069680 RepID=M7NPL2_PNEMU|nr:hypothetical protein PNEG_02813 [Pneumocystis murina B123]EMR09041.2 hypothetical protein PNEG_02813 [Pneumocystis murina B123]
MEEQVICQGCIQKLIARVEKDSTTNNEKQISSEDPYKLKLDHDDPEHPFMWNSKKKFFHLIIMLIMVFTMFLSLTFYVSHVLTKPELHTHLFLLTSMFSGFALGPFIGAPLSKHFGNRKIFLIFVFIFTIFHIFFIMISNKISLIIFRFLNGLFGGIIFSSCRLSIFDIFSNGGSFSKMLLQSSVLLGIHMGPVVGLALEENGRTVWWFWTSLILSAIIFVSSILILKEASPEIILNKRIKRLRRVTGSSRFIACIEDKKPLRYVFLALLKMSWNILGKDFMLLFVIISKVIIWNTIFLILFIHPFSLTKIYKGTLLNFFLLLLFHVLGILLATICYKIYNELYIKRQKQNKIKTKLLPSVIIYPLYISSLFWMGFTTHTLFHYIIPVLSHIVMGFSETLILDSLNQYIETSYSDDPYPVNINLAFSKLIASTIIHAIIKKSLVQKITILVTIIASINVFSYIISLVLFILGSSLRSKIQQN